GGLLMIVILALLFRWTLTLRLTTQARREAERDRRGRMEGHAEMDMAVSEGPFLARLLSARGLTSVSHSLWMDVSALWLDIGLYLLAVSYLAMVAAGMAIELLFQVLGLVPSDHHVTALRSAPSLDYTTVLNLLALLVMALLGWRFLRTGGLQMLRMMEGAAEP